MTFYHAQDTVTTLIGRGVDTLYGRPRWQWWFSTQVSNSLFYSLIRVVDSIGYVYEELEGGFNEYLLGAVINVGGMGSEGRGVRAREAGNGGWGVGNGVVTLKVYDVLGREVAVLVNERKAPGKYEVAFEGSGLASGVYVYRLTSGSFVWSRKMLLSR